MVPKMLQDLQKRFPEEKEAIERYVDLVVKRLGLVTSCRSCVLWYVTGLVAARCNKSADLHFFGKLFPRFLQKVLDPILCSTFNKLASRTVQDVLDELFQSELLKAILAGQFGDYGMFLGDRI